MPVIDNTVSKYLASIGRRGGSVRSEAKARAARRNGRRHVGKAKAPKQTKDDREAMRLSRLSTVAPGEIPSNFEA